MPSRLRWFTIWRWLENVCVHGPRPLLPASTALSVNCCHTAKGAGGWQSDINSCAKMCLVQGSSSRCVLPGAPLAGCRSAGGPPTPAGGYA